MRVGVLGYQGGIYEQVYMLRKAAEELGVECRVEVVVEPRELRELDALVIPGGESTTISKMMLRHGMDEEVRERIEEGMAVLGVCAGAILLATRVRDYHTGKELKGNIGVMNVEILRNYYGRQRQSFEVDVKIPELGEKPFRCIFIRAPAITKVHPPAKALASYNGVYIAARQGGVIAATFHPELSGDPRFHMYFIEEARR